MSGAYTFNCIEIRVSENNLTDIYIDGTKIKGVTGFEFECKKADTLGHKPRIRLNMTFER